MAWWHKTTHGSRSWVDKSVKGAVLIKKQAQAGTIVLVYTYSSHVLVVIQSGDKLSFKFSTKLTCHGYGFAWWGLKCL